MPHDATPIDMLPLAALAADMPDHLLSLLASHARAKGDPSTALAALRQCGGLLAGSLGARPSESAKADATDLAKSCALRSPELVDELSRLLPGFWQTLAAHGPCMAELARCCPETPEGRERARRTADLAASWLGEGLCPAAWRSLARIGGPLWRACVARSGHAAGPSPAQESAPSSALSLSWRAAARLRRAFGPLGPAGHGERGDWAHILSKPSPSFAQRLEAAEGLRQLVDEVERGSAHSGHLGRAGLLGRVLGQALGASEDNGAWAKLAIRCAKRLHGAACEGSAVAAALPMDYGLAPNARPTALAAGAKGAHAFLPEALALSRWPEIREAGFALGATSESAGALWSSWRSGLGAPAPGDAAKPASAAYLAKRAELASAIEEKALEIELRAGAPSQRRSARI